MELVHVVSGGLALGAVDGYSVPDLILHDEHSELLELLAQLLDVIADEADVDIHIRSVIEDIQRAVNIDFKGSCDALCLRLRLTSQDVIEVFENMVRIGSPGAAFIMMKFITNTINTVSTPLSILLRIKRVILMHCLLFVIPIVQSCGTFICDCIIYML